VQVGRAAGSLKRIGYRRFMLRCRRSCREGPCTGRGTLMQAKQDCGSPDFTGRHPSNPC
jgi:hypothetical protein